jgi:drug/metabolite transporter (DMT)-like permease
MWANARSVVQYCRAAGVAWSVSSRSREWARRVKDWLALLGTILAWAITFHVAKHVVALMPPLAGASWRFIIASLFLIPVVSFREAWDWAALRRNRWALLFLGTVGIAGFQLGMFYGLMTSSATNAALIMALSPALTVTLVAVLERRGISLLRAAGLVLGLVGVTVVATRGSWAQLLALQFGRGDLWMFMAACTWSIYSVVLRRYVHGLSVLQLSASTILICAVGLVLVAAALTPSQLQLPPTATWGSLLFMGIVGSGFAYLWWNQGVIKMGAARASTFMNLTPLFTMLIGVTLGEPVSFAQLAGGALIIGGVLMATHAGSA